MRYPTRQKKQIFLSFVLIEGKEEIFHKLRFLHKTTTNTFLVLQAREKCSVVKMKMSSSGTSNFLLKENKSNHMEDQPGLLYNRSVCYIEFSGGFCRGFIV